MDFVFEDRQHSVSKLELFEEWLKKGKNERNAHIYGYVSSKFDFRDITKDSEIRVKSLLASFSSRVAAKWSTVGKSKELFLTKFKDWLESEDVELKVSIAQPAPGTSSKNVTPAGRPRKNFEDSSFKTKKRRVGDLIQTRSACELLTAAEVAVRSAGNRKMAKVLKDISGSSDKSEVSVTSHMNTTSRRQLSSDEALAYYIDSKSTTQAYKKTREWSMKAGHYEYPSYHCLHKAKIACFPPEERIRVTETRVEIDLQAILDKTVERLALAQKDVINSCIPNSSSFRLISKWGCDGSSGYSEYKQKFENSEDSDQFLFVFSFVPLRLVDDGNNIIWQNPRTSSTMFCRPIQFIFAKETTELTVSETQKVLEEINNLSPSVFRLDDFKISVTHELLLTMTDGKICNALTDTRSAQTCFICGATPKMMNEDAANFESNEDNFGFGLSTLNAWIRCFECLLHISYKLEIKKWQARSDEEKSNVKQRSDAIRKLFKKDMGLIVDKPKPGFGSTNDGNTARRFFGDPELSAQITGLDVRLIKNFDILLRTLSSGYEINLVEFNKLCLETRRLYLSLYSWYYMPAIVHKILIHSLAIIKSAIVPIGQLSEEAQEARNKDSRRFRTHNTRKCSRFATNRDLLSMLLITSDPLINNSLREIPKKKVDTLPSEVLKLLSAPIIEPNRPAPRLISQPEEDYYLPDIYNSDDEDEDMFAFV